MPKSKRPRKPFLGNKFRIHSLEAKLLTARLGKNMQTTLAWVLALDQRLRALEPQPAADAAPSEAIPATPTEGEPATPPTDAQAAPTTVPIIGGPLDGQRAEIIDSKEEPGNE